MKILFSVLVFLIVTEAHSQNYLVTFAGSGAATTVASVKVENLNSGVSLVLNGSDILRLTVLTSVPPFENGKSSEMKIYPNPMAEKATMEIFPPVAGDAVITVYELTGKKVAQVRSYLENNLQEFSLSGIKSGFYLISVNGNTYNYSGKLLCNSNSDGTFTIAKVSNNPAVVEKQPMAEKKGIQTTLDMAYTAGDRLKFTGISGNFSTVKTDIPVSDKTITFNFIACTDGDNNNYPVVEIGTQIWMAENLKTTKYSDGTDIPNVKEDGAWSSTSLAAYCDWDNNSSNASTLGRMYNWYSVMLTNPKNLCPTQWHVPSDDDWTTLTSYLGGESVAGGKLKEIGSTHWGSSNSATNETGFTAIGVGKRKSTGMFWLPGGFGYWWSLTESGALYGWNRDISGNNNSVHRGQGYKTEGYTVRCIKD
jgi:uncharacterized protein (TIGR02145 family)